MLRFLQSQSFAGLWSFHSTQSLCWFHSMRFFAKKRCQLCTPLIFCLPLSRKRVGVCKRKACQNENTSFSQGQWRFFLISTLSLKWFLCCSSETCPFLSLLEHLEKCWRQGLFRKNITFAQQDIADFGILAIKNNYNITSITFDANPDTFSMIAASVRFSLKQIFDRKTLTHYEVGRIHFNMVFFSKFNFDFISI